jgi:hypothetical protein
MENPIPDIQSYLEDQTEISDNISRTSMSISTENQPKLMFIENPTGLTKSYTLGTSTFPELYTKIDKLKLQILDKLHFSATEKITLSFTDDTVKFQIYYNLRPREIDGINALLKSQHPQTISSLGAKVFTSGNHPEPIRTIVGDSNSETTVDSQTRDLPPHTTVPNTLQKRVQYLTAEHNQPELFTSEPDYQYTYDENTELFHIDFYTEYPIFPTISVPEVFKKKL